MNELQSLFEGEILGDLAGSSRLCRRELPFGGFDLAPLRRRLGGRVGTENLSGGRVKVAFADDDAERAFFDYCMEPGTAGYLALEYDPELLAFDPPEELMRPSVHPLWMIRPVHDKCVIIERLWDK